ncbi:hypothetical protein PHISCL_01403 [Aspergillus sclerotialis]|uniref:RNA polymerase II transcription factor SIII n=1 Tax=Aspergillus sclerotialis TaxID=2070753 RepID=A0A3A3A8F5_9EURO|nr:hypothetical protein PHISCL_01403 [Aspergillus sclerotialis]
MPPPSLLQLSTAAAIRNVKYLNDIGSIPYALARPFLLKVESPEKLRSLEIQSPHIMKDDNELWLELIKRDIPKWEEYNLPKESECWYEIYCDLREQVQKSVDKDAEKMKMALDGINSERAKHNTKFVTDRRSIRLPRERPTAKQRYASYDRKMGGIAPIFASPKSGLSTSDPLGAPAWSFERPQIPRSEASSAPRKKNNIFNAPRRNNVLSVPTKQLNSRATQIKQAPRALVEEHRRPAEPIVARRKGPPTLAAPGRSRLQSTSKPDDGKSTVTGQSFKEREARLRALTSGSPPAPRTTQPSERPHISSTTSTPSSSTPPNNTAQVRPAKPSPQSHSQIPTPGDSQTTGNKDESENKANSSQSPRPAIIRKRPAPSVFMMPKRKRIS